VKPLKRYIYNKILQLELEGEIDNNQKKRIKRGKGIVGRWKTSVMFEPTSLEMIELI
jgi:hypothetical protein